MRIAILSPVAWRTPPLHYGPWEQIASSIAEGLVARGIDVTLFATLDSLTTAKLDGVCPVGYEGQEGWMAGSPRRYTWHTRWRAQPTST